MSALAAIDESIQVIEAESGLPATRLRFARADFAEILNALADFGMGDPCITGTPKRLRRLRQAYALAIGVAER